MCHLTLLDVVQELEPRESEKCGKLLDSTLLSDLDFVSHQRLLFALTLAFISHVLELLLKVRGQEAD